MPPKKQPLHVLIVGAGLGGLSCAIATRLSGHRVTVLEQSPSLGEVGAGIQIPPNSSKILFSWDLGPALSAAAVHPEAFIIRSYRDGSELARQQMRGYVETEYGAPYLHIHRGDFHEVLVEKARELGVEIVLNAKVTAIDFEAPAVTIETGKTFTADLVVAADGLKSRCRELFLGRADPPKDTGDLAYRILVKTEDMKQDPLLRELTEVPYVNYWIGPDQHAVCYLLRSSNLYNIVLLSPDTLPPSTPIAPATPSELHALFSTWDPRLTRLLTLSTAATKWRLQNSTELPSWVHASSRFCLLGDACHATLPYLAQGAAMAVEDGAVLGGLLKGIGRGDGLGEVLRVYEELRKKRTTRVVRGSSELRGVFHMRDGEKQKERDRRLRGGERGNPMPWKEGRVQRWLFGYDAGAEVERAWKEGLEAVYGRREEGGSMSKL
ncbi:FAD/NAD(P)-binding domain-containing protein [Ascodesmis nigricans]|uniref:FAD/NAD(P)-binding domain-containing protein n=1 Tax=Ascodesmis nigricans TaxID=341454 RepID=A0A4S2MJY5_9PEZI|nr:FAD/NAD(P)-binding domain-containing protein [Ascodesmis nigricans]